VTLATEVDFSIVLYPVVAAIALATILIFLASPKVHSSSTGYLRGGDIVDNYDIVPRVLVSDSADFIDTTNLVAVTATTTHNIITTFESHYDIVASPTSQNNLTSVDSLLSPLTNISVLQSIQISSSGEATVCTLDLRQILMPPQPRPMITAPSLANMRVGRGGNKLKVLRLQSFSFDEIDAGHSCLASFSSAVAGRAMIHIPRSREIPFTLHKCEWIGCLLNAPSPKRGLGMGSDGVVGRPRPHDIDIGIDVSFSCLIPASSPSPPEDPMIDLHDGCETPSIVQKSPLTVEHSSERDLGANDRDVLGTSLRRPINLEIFNVDLSPCLGNASLAGAGRPKMTSVLVEEWSSVKQRQRTARKQPIASSVAGAHLLAVPRPLIPRSAVAHVREEPRRTLAMSITYPPGEKDQPRLPEYTEQRFFCC
jgi:hypothetical protein